MTNRELKNKVASLGKPGGSGCVTMTAKQAIKTRCRDCLAGARECTFTDCALKGLAKAQAGVSRIRAIRTYCQWCMNRNLVNQCSCTDCAIYRFRADTGGVLKVRFLPLKPLIIDCFNDPKSKDVNSHGKGNEAPQNAVF